MQDIEQFYLCKGMIYAEQNNISQAKKWFDLAGNSVNKRNNKDLYSKILEERLLCRDNNWEYDNGRNEDLLHLGFIIEGYWLSRDILGKPAWEETCWKLC